jgi:DNA gyrase subunit A
VVGFRQVWDSDEIMLITDRGLLIRTKVNEISIIGRVTQGVRLINIAPDEKVVDMAILPESEEEDEIEGSEEQAEGSPSTNSG